MSLAFILVGRLHARRGGGTQDSMLLCHVMFVRAVCKMTIDQESMANHIEIP